MRCLANHPDPYIRNIAAEIKSTGKFISGSDFWGNDWHNGSGGPAANAEWRDYVSAVQPSRSSKAEQQQLKWEEERLARIRERQRQAEIEWAEAALAKPTNPHLGSIT
jgi:hypothetical protein